MDVHHFEAHPGQRVGDDAAVLMRILEATDRAGVGLVSDNEAVANRLGADGRRQEHDCRDDEGEHRDQVT